MISDVIKLLPEAVANQIAAGEVVQRPASVVKELVENSVDAGATSIQIIIKDAGRTLIQVVDNGCGMTPTDARMAFQHHATSKIDKAEDLYALHTMGFRGEALPSIAAVSQVEMRTMPRGETIGCRIRYADARFEGLEPFSCSAGTSIMVKNLFYNIPVRRNYLKSDSTELTQILREFERLALVNSGVDFTIVHNDVTLHQLVKGSLKQRITSLFGKAIYSQIIPLGTETPMVKISGFIGLPQHAKRRGFHQFFFVNGRNMKHPLFRTAVLNSYAELISADTQPSYFINFEVDPATIEVNVHPQKHEIKFANEQPIFQILTAAIRQALGKVNAAGGIDFDSDDAPDIPVFAPDASAPMPGIQTDPAYNPFNLSESAPTRSAHREAYVERRSRSNATADWTKLYESFTRRKNEPDEMPPAAPATHTVEIPSEINRRDADAPALFDSEATPQVLSVDNRFLIIPSRECLLVVHRYRAHVRVLFDKFMTRLAESPLPSQRLIFPESVTLSPSESSVLSSIAPLTARLGYDLSFLGDNVWSINAVPSISTGVSPVEILTRMIADIQDTGELSSASLLQPAALALARSAAVTPASEMSPEETDSLIASLMACAEPAYTPDGLKIIHTVTHAELAKMFA